MQKRTVSKNFDAYIAMLPPKQRTALQKLRKAIHAAAPGAEECISYQLPAFRLNGRALVAIGAAKTHCAFYPMSSRIVEQFKDDLRRFSTSKGTIRFSPEKPLSATLVRKLVKARIAENSSGRSKAASAQKIQRKRPSRACRSFSSPGPGRRIRQVGEQLGEVGLCCAGGFAATG